MKIFKILLVLGLLVLALIVALVVFVVMNLGAGIERAVERGGTYATQTQVTVDDASVSLTSGSLSLDGVQVDNPDGFDTPHFLRIEGADTTIDARAREVTALTFSGLDLHMEGLGEGSNHGRILESLKRFESGEPASGDDSQMGVVVRSLVFEDVTVNVSEVPGLALATGDVQGAVTDAMSGGGGAEVTITIPRVELNDLGADEMTWGEMFTLVVKTLMSATIDAGEGVLPVGLLQDLSGSLGELESLGGEVVTQVTEQVQRAIEDATGQIQDAVGDAAGQAGEAVQDAVDGAVEDAGKKVEDAIGNLLGGSKDDDGG